MHMVSSEEFRWRILQIMLYSPYIIFCTLLFPRICTADKIMPIGAANIPAGKYDNQDYSSWIWEGEGRLCLPTTEKATTIIENPRYNYHVLYFSIIQSLLLIPQTLISEHRGHHTQKTALERSNPSNLPQLLSS